MQNKPQQCDQDLYYKEAVCDNIQNIYFVNMIFPDITHHDVATASSWDGYIKSKIFNFQVLWWQSAKSQAINQL